MKKKYREMDIKMDLITPQKKMSSSTQPKKFVPPKKVLSERKPENVLQISDSSESLTSTEDMCLNGLDSDIEFCVREEVQLWIATHGAKLFALECSKYLAAESKRKNIRGTR